MVAGSVRHNRGPFGPPRGGGAPAPPPVLLRFSFGAPFTDGTTPSDPATLFWAGPNSGLLLTSAPTGHSLPRAPFVGVMPPCIRVAVASAMYKSVPPFMGRLPVRVCEISAFGALV